MRMRPSMIARLWHWRRGRTEYSSIRYLSPFQTGITSLRFEVWPGVIRRMKTLQELFLTKVLFSWAECRGRNSRRTWIFHDQGPHVWWSTVSMWISADTHNMLIEADELQVSKSLEIRYMCIASVSLVNKLCSFYWQVTCYIIQMLFLLLLSLYNCSCCGCCCSTAVVVLLGSIVPFYCRCKVCSCAWYCHSMAASWTNSAAPASCSCCFCSGNSRNGFAVNISSVIAT